MTLRSFGLALAAAFVVLVALNAMLFPLLFPGGPPVKWAEPRPAPLLSLNALALAATALGLTLLCGVFAGGGAGKAALAAALAALLASLPSALHSLAGTRTTFGAQLLPIAFTTATWVAAGAAIGWTKLRCGS